MRIIPKFTTWNSPRSYWKMQSMKSPNYRVSEKRTALRLAIHLLKQPRENTSHLTQALNNLREHIEFCSSCHNLSDVPVCEICSNPARDDSLLCVVEDIRDVIAIENTGQFKKVSITFWEGSSPIDGVGPQDLKIWILWSKKSKKVK